jgi:hypothetical protein
MALPGTNVVTNIKVEVDTILVGIQPLNTAPVIDFTAPSSIPYDNGTVEVAYDENLETKDIIFKWNTLAGATEYELEISEDSEFPLWCTWLFEGIADITYTLLAYYFKIDMGLYFRVRGVNGYKVSPWSTVVSFSITKEVLDDGVEKVILPTDSGDLTQYMHSVNDPVDGKKNMTVKGPMKLKVAVDGGGVPTELTTFLKDGDMWYDETGE